MADVTNHQKFPITLQFHAISANCMGVPPHALHIFHIHLCDNPHPVRQHPCETTLHMPPHGTRVKILSNHTILHLTLRPSCSAIWKPTTHSHPKFFQQHPFAHIFGPCIHHSRFVAPLQHQFNIFYIPLLALLWISDRHASLLHHSSFIVLVYC